MYRAGSIGAFIEHLPVLERLAESRRPGSRPLAMLRAAWGAQRDEPVDRVRALAELGWEGGRYLSDGDSLEILPQGIGAHLLYDEFDSAVAMVDRVRAAARASGSVMLYLTADGHQAYINTRLGNLTAAAAEMRDCIERAIEAGLQFVILSILWYCADVLLERPDVADLAALVETIDVGPLAEMEAGALLIQTRGRLRFAAGERAAAIADARQAGAVSAALGITNSFAAPWRSTLALMLDSADRDEALALTNSELDDARRAGRSIRIGVALRARGTLEHDRGRGRADLEQAVSVLADSPARLEHARALVELGSSRRRAGERAAARPPLRDGLDLATRCGAIRLSERARTELAATGARPRRASTSGRDALTPSELRVARVAADGRTSHEIAQTLFVTTKTIDGHLNRTYTKLGINSRKQLANALSVGRQ
jgi:DNA-binding CsgD family transcriptional regulator